MVSQIYLTFFAHALCMYPEFLTHFAIIMLDWERCCYSICRGMGLDDSNKVTVLQLSLTELNGFMYHYFLFKHCFHMI